MKNVRKRNVILSRVCVCVCIIYIYPILKCLAPIFGDDIFIVLFYNHGKEANFNLKKRKLIQVFIKTK